MTGPEEGGTLICTSGVSLFDGEGFVIVRWGDKAGQMSPAAARALGLHIIAAADGADGDAALVATLTETGLSQEESAGMLALVRERRAKDDS